MDICILNVSMYLFEMLIGINEIILILYWFWIEDLMWKLGFDRSLNFEELILMILICKKYCFLNILFYSLDSW